MSLADLIAADVSDVFLNEDDFAETLTYYPKGEAVREISATRVSLGMFLRQAHPRETDQDEHHEKQVDKLAFFVTRDATTGMPNPQLGDAIRLATDPVHDRWDFVSIEETDAVSFIVVFQKTRNLRAGMKRPARL